jgi:hypothetical protein
MPLGNVCTVQRMVKEFRKTFSWQQVASFKDRAKVRKKLLLQLCPKTLNVISEMLTEDPTLYLAQIRSALIDDHGVKVSRSCICRAIHLPEQDGGLGLSLQVLEKRTLQRNTLDHENWHNRINTGDFDHKNVIVIVNWSAGATGGATLIFASISCVLFRATTLPLSNLGGSSLSRLWRLRQVSLRPIRLTI